MIEIIAFCAGFLVCWVTLVRPTVKINKELIGTNKRLIDVNNTLIQINDSFIGKIEHDVY